MKKFAFVVAAFALASIPFVCPAVEPESSYHVPTEDELWWDGEYHPYYEPTIEDVQAAPDFVAVDPELVSTVPNQEWETGFGQALALNYGLHKGERDLATEELVLADIRKEFGLQIDYCFMCGEITMDETQGLPLCQICHDMLEVEVCTTHEETQLDCGCWKE